MTKAMNLFSTVVGTVNDPINAAINAYTLKNLIKAPASTVSTVTAVVTGTTGGAGP